MRLYLCGPMRGYPEWNRAEFTRVAWDWRAQGNHVISPHEQTENFGETWQTHTGEEKDHLRKVGLMDVAIVFAVDGLILLKGWQHSRGATMEVALAKFLKLPLFNEDGTTNDIDSTPWGTIETLEAMHKASQP